MLKSSISLIVYSNRDFCASGFPSPLIVFFARFTFDMHGNVQGWSIAFFLIRVCNMLAPILYDFSCVIISACACSPNSLQLNVKHTGRIDM